jgi:uncharacterized membrane protein
MRAALVRTQMRILVIWSSYRNLITWVASIAALTGCIIFLVGYWADLDAYLGLLEVSVLPDLAIGVGAAITGIIAIAFSLSLFAIQQVADRGTPSTLRAYARDRILRLTYWLLVLFATTCFGLALMRVRDSGRAATAVLELLLLLGSFVLLNLHFGRVTKFADPRFTIKRVYERGEKQLRLLRFMIEDLSRRAERGAGRRN